MRVLKFLLALTTLLTLTACMHNRGDIGIWFGTWKCTAIEVDGEPDTAYGGNMFFKFQTDICEIVTVGDHHSYTQSWSHFEDRGDILFIDFSYTDEWDSSLFTPPSGSYLNNGSNELRIDRPGKRNIRLTLTKADDTTIVYTLKKE